MSTLTRRSRSSFSAIEALSQQETETSAAKTGLNRLYDELTEYYLSRKLDRKPERLSDDYKNRKLAVENIREEVLILLHSKSIYLRDIEALEATIKRVGFHSPIKKKKRIPLMPIEPNLLTGAEQTSPSIKKAGFSRFFRKGLYSILQDGCHSLAGIKQNIAWRHCYSDSELSSLSIGNALKDLQEKTSGQGLSDLPSGGKITLAGQAFTTTDDIAGSIEKFIPSTLSAEYRERALRTLRNVGQDAINILVLEMLQHLRYEGAAFSNGLSKLHIDWKFNESGLLTSELSLKVQTMRVDTDFLKLNKVTNELVPIDPEIDLSRENKKSLPVIIEGTGQLQLNRDGTLSLKALDFSSSTSRVMHEYRINNPLPSPQLTP